ncbi:MAG: hypothetical protein ACPG34_03170 [Poseidonia sp.]
MGLVVNNRWLLLLLVVLVLMPMRSVSADDDVDDEDDEDDEAQVLGLDAEGLGEVAQWLMVGTLLIVVWKPLFKWLRTNGPERFGVEARPFKKKLGVFNRRFMRVHVWIGLAAVVLGTIHGYVLEWHWSLWLAMLFLWLLVVSGALMMWKTPPKQIRKASRLLHMQRAMSVLAVALLLIGHALVD